MWMCCLLSPVAPPHSHVRCDELVLQRVDGENRARCGSNDTLGNTSHLSRDSPGATRGHWTPPDAVKLMAKLVERFATVTTRTTMANANAARST